MDGQNLKADPSCDFKNIVSGTKGYLRTEFSFGREWNGLVKVAEFRKWISDETVSVPVIGNKCMVPNEVTDGMLWKVRIIGKRGSMRLTTNEVGVEQIE